MKVFTYFDTDKHLPKGWNCTNTIEVFNFYTSNYIESFGLRNFPGDCGSLVLTQVSRMSREALKLVRQIASICGFDTVVCTYVNLQNTTDTETVQNFKKERWIKAVDGKSNRKHKYEKNRKIVYILHIRNCEHKGY